jgi:uncharacterized protein (DUF2249 family)
MVVSTQESIRAEWKVSAVLARYPQLLRVLVDLSPAFGHLRNPLARTLRTRLVSVAEAALKIIMAAMAGVPEQGALQLRTSFEPVPLYEVLARRGFSHSSRRLAADDWEVIFTRAANELPSPRCARASCQPGLASPIEVTDSEEVVHLDVSDLVPPEPMVRIFEAASKLERGQTLLVEHHRRPVYLYPQLDAPGYVHETNELGPRRVQILIRRA